MIFAIFFVIGSMSLLYWSTHQLLRSSVQIALAVGVSPLVIGLTLVAFATSFPEILTSAIAQIQGISGDVALENVLGSNTANIGLVLGIALLIYPVRIPPKIKTIEMPILLFFSCVLGCLMLQGSLGRWVGGCFIVLACGYLAFEWFYGGNGEPIARNQIVLWKVVLFFCLSLMGLILGAKGLVEGGVNLARLLHVPERIIAISVIAIGTSLPELMTVIIAATHRKDALILGTIVGSNILNLLFIVGLSALIRPLIFTPLMLKVDIPVMIGFTGVLWFSMWKRSSLPRLAGVFYLILYLVYLLLIIK